MLPLSLEVSAELLDSLPPVDELPDSDDTPVDNEDQYFKTNISFPVCC